MSRRLRSTRVLYVLGVVLAVGLTLWLARRPDGLPDVAWPRVGWLLALAVAGYYAKERRTARLRDRRDDSVLYQRNYNDDPGSFR